MAAGAQDLLSDPLLRSLPTIAGYKVINSIALMVEAATTGRDIRTVGDGPPLE